MKILFAATEAAPFIKTGGLGDVAGSLPRSLAALGHEVTVILPLYEGIDSSWREQMTFLRYDSVQLSWRNAYCGIFTLRRDGVTFWFVDNESYFKRQNLYGYFDDGERFAFFSRAVIETPLHLDWIPDVIHCNDWHTALVSVYLLEERKKNSKLCHVKSLYTIHNMEYQGIFPESVLEDVCGLPRSYWNEQMLAHSGAVNLMKGGIYAADALTTVSPTYAYELRFPFYAHGMEEAIRQNLFKLQGILNGIDAAFYNPRSDAGLTCPFSPEDLSGKALCKTALQRIANLREDPKVPVIACVSRLVRHKGFDLVTEAISKIMEMDVQMVVLGTGNWNYEEAFRHAAVQYPSRFSAHLMYSPSLATAIYGGADLFLMPSICEPCGLAQMIAMRYGTIPIVRETGGLRDTVPPWNPNTQTGFGFTFVSIHHEDMLDAIHRAVSLYRQAPDAWYKLQQNAMNADYSWNSSAKEYDAIYHRLVSSQDENGNGVLRE